MVKLAGLLTVLLMSQTKVNQQCLRLVGVISSWNVSMVVLSGNGGRGSFPVFSFLSLQFHEKNFSFHKMVKESQNFNVFLFVLLYAASSFRPLPTIALIPLHGLQNRRTEIGGI